MTQRDDAYRYGDRDKPWFRQDWNEGSMDKTKLPPPGYGNNTDRPRNPSGYWDED